MESELDKAIWHLNHEASQRDKDNKMSYQTNPMGQAAAIQQPPPRNPDGLQNLLEQTAEALIACESTIEAIANVLHGPTSNTMKKEVEMGVGILLLSQANFTRSQLIRDSLAQLINLIR